MQTKPASPLYRKNDINKWLSASALWLSLVGASLLWNLQLFNDSVEHLALSEARSLFNKDLLYRRWAAMQGGVYVPPTEKTPPNPYLDVPERDVVTTTGKKLTLVNPAYMVRQVHEMSSAQGDLEQGHITSRNPLRPQNKPDAWEDQVLERFETGVKEYSSIETINGKPILRYMGAMLVEKPCLKCHEKQGYKEGDVRGGISVSVSMERFENIEHDHTQSLYFWHFVIGLLGLAGITLGLRRISSIEAERFSTRLKLGRYAERHALLENVGEGVYALNEKGECSVINHAALELLGYREEEVVGMNAHRLFHHHHPDGREFPQSECEMHRAISEQKRLEGETTFFRKNGEMFPVYYVATPVTAMEETQGFAVVVGFHDISDRKETELRTAALLKRNQVMMQSSHEGIHLMNDQGNVIEANEAFCLHLGYTQTEVLRLNVSDFDAKLSPNELKENIRRLLTGHTMFETVHRRKDGTLVDVELSISGVELAGQRYLLAFCRDITDRKKAESEIKQMAFYDPLTGLANRRLMTDRMEQALAHARRTGELVAVCMIDLDGFKQVNDSIGHQGGDQLLIEVARRLQECIRQTDTASRLGGDEFVLILGGFKKISECEQSLNRIIADLAMPYSVVNEIANVSASIGATLFPNDGGTPDLLLRHADLAMYEAKQAGKNCYRLFNPTHHDQQQANQATLRKIEKALKEGQLMLYYQPQVDCRLGKVIGMEALIRWEHPILGLLPPSEFIPLLEHDDLVITVGEWVIREALKQLTAWRTLGLDLKVSVNISARQLHQHDFPTRLQALLSDFVPDVISHLEIEILETAALEDVNTVAEAMRKCRTYGINFALDDFGTGFSSLAHLKQLPMDMLKIDRSFVSGMLTNSGDMAIVRGVVGLASSFRRGVTAEGVESIDHILLLMEMGCFLMQGYCLGRPMPAQQVVPWTKSFKPDPLWQLHNAKRPTRSYFELLLAEASHRHWIERIVANAGDSKDDDDELLADHRQCQLGRWYYGEGEKLFGKESWFRSLEHAHQQIHLTAARLRAHKADRSLSEAEVDEADLQAQHAELESILNRARKSIADEYLMTEPTTPPGERP